jgi:DNA primase
MDIATIVEKRGIKLTKQGKELVGSCPNCGGDDRFAVHLTDQVFNCRGCSKGGKGAISFVQFLDGCDFKSAVGIITGEKPPPKEKTPKEKKGQGALLHLLRSGNGTNPKCQRA